MLNCLKLPEAPAVDPGPLNSGGSAPFKARVALSRAPPVVTVGFETADPPSGIMELFQMGNSECGIKSHALSGAR